MHSLESLQLSGIPTQVPATHVSFIVQGSRSSQPRAACVWMHVEVVGLHTSSVHTFPSEHASGTHWLPQHTCPAMQLDARMHVARSVEHCTVSQVPGVGMQFEVVSHAPAN